MAAIIYSTIGSIKDAEKIAKNLVEEHLVACVNILPNIDSVYRWEGKIECDKEVVIIAKTTDEKVEKTIKRIKSLHSYKVPDIIVLPIIGGLKEYLEYIENETS